MIEVTAWICASDEGCIFKFFSAFSFPKYDVARLSVVRSLRHATLCLEFSSVEIAVRVNLDVTDGGHSLRRQTGG